MGTVVVGYVPKPEGEAALATAISEAKLRGSKLVVVNSHRGGHEFDRDKARAAEGEMDAVRARSTSPASSTTSASSCAASSPPRT